jgi:hypothetical protein
MHTFNRGHKWTKNYGLFCYLKKLQKSNQAPNKRKFAQSGRPVEGPLDGSKLRPQKRRTPSIGFRQATKSRGPKIVAGFFRM